MSKFGPVSQVDLHVGQRLALAMRLAGVSSADLAAALAVDDATISRWIAGQQRVGADTLREVVLALNQPVAFFFLGNAACDAATAANQSAIAMLEGRTATLH